MGVLESEHIYGIGLRESANDGSDFTNPDADYRVLFLGEDGLLHLRDSSGTVTTPSGGAPAESDVTFTDITTNNASTSKHGYLKKLDNNAAHFMDGTGEWSTPSGSSFPTTAYAEQSADVTLSAADTPTDVPGTSITLGAGTWDISAVVSFQGVTASYALAFIVSGTSTLVASGRTSVALNEYETVPLMVRVTPGVSTTYKLRGQMGGTTNKVKRFPDGSVIGTAIRAIQVA